VVLLSGGLDSATVLAQAVAAGYACHALSFDYGQRHRAELDAAAAVAEQLDAASHRVIGIDLRSIGGSALTDAMDVPKDREADAMSGDIPVTYVPARNTVFLSYALAVAEVTGAADVFLGVNAVDYSGYPDCRPAYLRAFETMANLATKAGVETAAAGRRWLTLHAPLVELTKVQIIQRGLALGVDYGLTHSCYDPPPPEVPPPPEGADNDPAAAGSTSGGRACGHCDACLLRRRAFAQLGMDDPVRAVA
jgi:7-cyano-7-deazaguanine synthase